ncbi:TetR/AcrR family transcriptional regulator [Fibrella aquatilis]|uniref:TetR/AcrR family transcriptional regulator n=1 Tax=Fibrella aquatilis TaxID=2817059 RepID=A0A939GDZ4_9BACT|nr:TetR/AcrR family transcriptional regulator [Fibrella aquatilis]MBO0934817.1 TetR/AcrR family transcriptional regulator [Fibrella aquatilis]
MNYSLHLQMNEKLYLRDPEQSDLGRRIVRQGILLIHEIGFEETTFRKLAERLGTKEASIYRYFENKHRLLVYIVAWYWRWLDYQVVYETNNITSPRQKLERILPILLQRSTDTPATPDDIDLRALHNVVIREASKAYLTRHVSDDNREQLFKPYKDLCGRLADLILDFNPNYPYARSRASSLIETAHYQAFFMENLPSLTNFGGEPTDDTLLAFLHHLLFSSIERTVKE